MLAPPGGAEFERIGRWMEMRGLELRRKTMRRTSLGLVVIALLLAGTAAHAEEDVEADNDIFHRDGGYFGL